MPTRSRVAVAWQIGRPSPVFARVRVEIRITVHCLEPRRSLLVDPRAAIRAHREHLDVCRGCARLAATLGAQTWAMEEAALVSVPDALAERVLWHRPHASGRLVFAVAAALGILRSPISRVLSRARIALPARSRAPETR